MKHFLKNLFVFILIPISVFILAEYILLNSNNSFHKKYNFIENNKDSIEILALGSSHNQTAINPKYLKHLTANLAFGGQDLKLDSFLLNKYLLDLPKLKYVLFELSYHSLEHRQPQEYHRNTLYFVYYGIDNFEKNKKNILEKYSIFLSAPSLYSKLLNPFYSVEINKFGFRTSINPEASFYKLNFDSITINSNDNNNLIKRHKYRNIKNLEKNINAFKSMLNTCVNNKFTPIILIPPVYDTYYRNMIPQKKAARDLFLRELKQEFSKIIILDFENNDIFALKYFNNDDHLNISGAKVFTKILNKEILELDSINIQ